MLTWSVLMKTVYALQTWLVLRKTDYDSPILVTMIIILFSELESKLMQKLTCTCCDQLTLLKAKLGLIEWESKVGSKSPKYFGKLCCLAESAGKRVVFSRVLFEALKLRNSRDRSEALPLLQWIKWATQLWSDTACSVPDEESDTLQPRMIRLFILSPSAWWRYEKGSPLPFLCEGTGLLYNIAAT